MHSGLKGSRYNPCKNPKYEGLKGYIVNFDLDTLEQGKSMHWVVENSPVYEWWDTSMLIAVYENKDNGTIILETLNTIYKLKRVDTPNEELKSFTFELAKELIT